MAKKSSGSRRAEAALAKWGSCQGQAELFTRPQLSKAKPAPKSSKDKR